MHKLLLRFEDAVRLDEGTRLLGLRERGVASDARVPGWMLAALVPVLVVVFLVLAAAPARRAGRLAVAKASASSER